MLNITRVELHVTPGPLTLGDIGMLKAYINLELDGCFMIRSLKLVEMMDGKLVVLMPSHRNRQGRYRDIAHPLTEECRLELEKVVLSNYAKVAK